MPCAAGSILDVEGDDMPSRQSSDREEPPTTVRPHVPIVTALEASRPTEAFLERMRELLVPGEWIVEHSTGFWWVPFRLQHAIDLVVPDPETGTEVACRSEIRVVDRIESAIEAVNICHYFNQRPFGGAMWYDDVQKAIFVTSSLHLKPENWFNAFIFESTVSRLIGICERLAPRLSGLVDGKVPDTEHPVLGRRETPDQFYDEHLATTYTPEATTGLWWSRREIEAFRRGVRFFLQTSDLDDYADQLDPYEYENDLTAMENFAVSLQLPCGASEAMIRVGDSDHPDLGRGMELLLVSPFRLEGETNLAVPPSSSFEAMWVANMLNQTQRDGLPLPLSISGWTTWRGQLCLSAFIDAETSRVLQHLASPRAGEAMAVVTEMFCRNMRFLEAAATETGIFDTDWEYTEEVYWRGVSQNAGHFSLLVDDATLVRELTDGLPTNEVFDAIEVDGLWALQHSRLIAAFGIFNPVGPSVGSIEIAINYGSGRAMLLERLRHPFVPAIRLYALLDREGFEDLPRFVEAMVSKLEWGSVDWFEVVDRGEEVGDALRRGLRNLATATEADVAVEASWLRSSLESPWVRLTKERPPEWTLPRGASAVEWWIEAVTKPENIDTHVAYLRSAWEGAKAFIREDGQVAASNISEACKNEVLLRIDG